MNLNDVKSIYFLGIGGIGMSGLARFFKLNEIEVKGYDKTSTSLTRTLEDEGIDIQYVENVEHIPTNVDLVVWTPALPVDSTLLDAVKKRNITLLKRSEVLGHISRNMKTLAIAGTHGKTTTSTMLTHLLKSSKIDCTAFVGGISSNYGSNFLKGHGDVLVLEADEYDRSFLQLRPHMAVLTNMDPDHLDIYGDISEMHRTYLKFCQLVDRDGFLLVHYDLMKYLEGLELGTVRSYGNIAGDFKADRIKVQGMQVEFDFVFPEGRWCDLRMHMPGEHNINNAVGALALAQQCGVTEEEAKIALDSFLGIKRRFELIAWNDHQMYIDDYAHHPHEIAATISACRQSFPDKKLTGIFQPHLFSRTKDFADDFARALDGLDECIVMDIYPAREKPIPGIDAKYIISKMNGDKVCYMTRHEIVPFLKRIDFQVLLTLGAGDIDQLVEPIKDTLFKKDN